MLFEYKLEGVGWADVKIIINDCECVFSPSYVTEPLGDLVEDLVTMITGFIPEDELMTNVTFHWDEEPTIVRWNFIRQGSELFKIKVTTYEDDLPNGKVVLNELCNFNAFVSEVVRTLENLLSKHGIVGYKETWSGRDFPISGYLKLKHYIDGNKKYPIKTINENAGKKSELSHEISTLTSLGSQIS